MKDNYAGIDYGRGISNVDVESGIRYGVISQNEVLEAWCDSSEPVYVYWCPKCENELGTDIDENCPHCNYEFQDGDFDMIEPVSFIVDDGEYKAECGEDGDIFIINSPYYTYAQFCSPCAPGAVYIMNSFKGKASKAEDNGFAKGYCLGHDWFEDEKAPYPVYSVATGKIVKP